MNQCVKIIIGVLYELACLVVGILTVEYSLVCYSEYCKLLQAKKQTGTQPSPIKTDHYSFYNLQIKPNTNVYQCEIVKVVLKRKQTRVVPQMLSFF